MALEDAKGQIDLAFTRDDLKGCAFENTFGGATSFLRRKYTKDLRGVDLAVTGVPFDQAVTNRPGTRFGPRAIREASTLQPYDPPYGWGFDPLGEFAIADVGDLAFDYANVAGTPAAIAKYGPVGVIQFDAHSDLWADDDMDRVDHGTFMYKAVKLGLVDPKRAVQIGIRTVCDDYCGIEFIDARTVHEKGSDWVAQRAKDIVGDGATYVTFDIDALDPAFAPGTGTPVWGGLASWQAAAMLRDLAGINMVGGDIVEVSPAYDSGGITAVAGAHVAFELCCLHLWNKRNV
jgi:agmatinase